MVAGGRITTHVLDTAGGRPASGVGVSLLRHHPDGGTEELARTHTNADGRPPEPLLVGSALQSGRYELIFEVGAYFAAQGHALPDPPFLEHVSIQFGVADADARYHVPLLISPWSYATYRGS